jgi:hypothetical protein
MTYGHELVNLRTRPPMVGKFLVDAWRCCGGSTEEHSISVHSVSNFVFIMKKGAKVDLALNDIGCSW